MPPSANRSKKQSGNHGAVDSRKIPSYSQARKKYEGGPNRELLEVAAESLAID